MIKNIIFDWTGVINDNMPASLYAMNYIFKYYGAREITVEEMKREMIMPYPLFYEKFVPGIKLEKLQELYKIGYPEGRKIYPTHCFPNMDKTLKKFKEAGINMIIISSDHTSHLFEEMENYGLNGFFSEIYGDVVNKKVGLKEILAKHGFNHDDTIFIGDTCHEIDSGKSVGILTGAVTWGFQNEDSLRNAKPDFVWHNPEELEKTILG